MMDWPPDPALYPPYLRLPIRKGMGIGTGTNYRPWRRFYSQPTRSNSTVVLGIRVQRNYEFVSTASTGYFFLLERQSQVVDIRERWPILDLRRTLQLTAQYGISHPRRNLYPEPLTFDFLITSRDTDFRYRAINLVRSVESMSEDEKVLMEIRETWCNERGIGWTLKETSKISRTVISGLRFIRAWHLNRYVPDRVLSEHFSARFLQTYAPNILLHDLVESTGSALRLRSETRLDTFRYCAWANLIPVSLPHRIACNCPLVLEEIES